LAWLAGSRPAWNFDGIGYAGSACRLLGYSDGKAHEKVFEELRRIAPARSLETMVAGSGYRKAIADDANAFGAQLRFYSDKPLYVALIAGAIALGANGVRAAFSISAIAYGLLACIVLLTLARSRSPARSCAFGLAVLLSPPFVETAALATPDMLSALVAFSALVSLSVYHRPRLGIALLSASLLVRPDNILLCIAALGWLSTRRYGRTFLLPGALSMAAAFVAVVLVTRPYSWNVIATHTFVAPMPGPAGMSGVMTPALYFHTIGKALGGGFVLHPSVAPLFIALSIFGWMASAGAVRDRDEPWSLLIGVWAAALVHFLVFPMLADRFFVAHYAIIAVILVASRPPLKTA
jgi:hypothetical protein